jgi:hypothetical protein
MPVSSSVESRERRAVESFKSAAEAIGEITAGMAVFCITRGQWSMIDAILYALDQVGASHISLWTWTVAEYEVQTLTRLRKDARVIGGRLLIDQGARVKNAGLIREWQASFGADSVRYVMNHAKLARVESASGLRLLLRGSMNLNFNPRFEQFDISEGGPGYDLVRRIEDEMPILADDCSGKEAWKASKVSAAFDQETLRMFSGVRVWAK